MHQLVLKKSFKARQGRPRLLVAAPEVKEAPAVVGTVAAVAPDPAEHAGGALCGYGELFLDGGHAVEAGEFGFEHL